MSWLQNTLYKSRATMAEHRTNLKNHRQVWAGSKFKKNQGTVWASYVKSTRLGECGLKYNCSGETMAEHRTNFKNQWQVWAGSKLKKKKSRDSMGLL